MPTYPLLQQPEGKTLEFKRDLSSPQNALKTLVAFANSAGGKLVIGVDDARQVVGVADPLAEEERICNLIADAIAPRLLPNIELMGRAGVGSLPQWGSSALPGQTRAGAGRLPAPGFEQPPGRARLDCTNTPRRRRTGV